ncbi:MAG: peptidase T, partial [Acetatifactor sp.]|nr:peptidase T [Acetatifactor sp.]
EDIVLNRELGVVLRTADFPEIRKYQGKDLIVTDGTTLLGADDKAGVAEIMTMAEYFLTHPEKPHGKLRIGFTPDEEIGAGPDFFDVALFGADAAYTVDGGALGELEYENFNAAGAKLHIQGCSVHPGSAKGKMKNAILIAQEFQSMLPVFENPMYTQGYEGFYHLDSIQGNVETVRADYIIRDHDRALFEDKKKKFMNVADFLNAKYGEGTVTVDMKDSYYNMREVMEEHMDLIDKVVETMEEQEIKPIITPIRGGTDGARLSFMGLPCPNICTGGENCHGKFEYACVQSMEQVVKLLTELAKKFV